MSTGWIVLIVVLVILVALIIGLYFLGKRAEKKQEEQNAQVEAKVGPKVMSLICDATIFDEIPVKKEVKARVSGLYITSVRGLHGKTESEDGKKKKKGLRAWALRKQKELNASK